MKRLITFLTQNPSYVKCGNQKIADATNISINTVARFKRSRQFKALNKEYREKIS